MPDKLQDNIDNNFNVIKKITLPDGFRVGIKNLDNILKDVAALGLNDARDIKTELLERVKFCNYVAASAEKEYAIALYHEFQRVKGNTHSSQVIDKPDINKPHGG